VKPKRTIVVCWGQDHNGNWHVVSDRSFPGMFRQECSGGTIKFSKVTTVNPGAAMLCVFCRESLTRRIVEDIPDDEQSPPVT
jgi:hypothetical protein